MGGVDVDAQKTCTTLKTCMTQQNRLITHAAGVRETPPRLKTLMIPKSAHGERKGMSMIQKRWSTTQKNARDVGVHVTPWKMMAEMHTTQSKNLLRNALAAVADAPMLWTQTCKEAMVSLQSVLVDVL